MSLRSSNRYYAMPGELDLTPFGFTATESLAYAALLRLGPSTGYAVAHATRGARAPRRRGGACGGKSHPQRDRDRRLTHSAADRRGPGSGRGRERRDDRRGVELASSHHRAGPRLDPGPRVRRLLALVALLLCVVGGCPAPALPASPLL